MLQELYCCWAAGLPGAPQNYQCLHSDGVRLTSWNYCCDVNAFFSRAYWRGVLSCLPPVCFCCGTPVGAAGAAGAAAGAGLQVLRALLLVRENRAMTRFSDYITNVSYCSFQKLKLLWRFSWRRNRFYWFVVLYFQPFLCWQSCRLLWCRFLISPSAIPSPMSGNLNWKVWCCWAAGVLPLEPLVKLLGQNHHRLWWCRLRELLYLLEL